MTSRDVPEQLIPKDDAGLPHTLKLAAGAQVMLRRNIMCEDGLVNGARGQIVGFKWSDGPSPTWNSTSSSVCEIS